MIVKLFKYKKILATVYSSANYYLWIYKLCLRLHEIFPILLIYFNQNVAY